MSRVISVLYAAGLLAAVVMLAPAPASAWFVPAPYDFITSGGFVFTDSVPAARGAHGGCKNGDFWAT